MGRVAGGAAGDPGDDAPAIRRDHQQLLGGQAARLRAYEPLHRASAQARYVTGAQFVLNAGLLT
jgi:hypothetical protein